VRRIAEFIRTHSQALAGAAPVRRGAPPPQAPGIFGWMTKPGPPMVYTTDLHHIFYLLMRFEELGVDVGPLDVRLPTESISRPLSYVSLLAANDKSDTGSIFSFKSISGVSKMSLGAGWWPRPQLPSVEMEIKSIYSAFTKIPALSIHQSSLDVISELANDPPVDHVVPLWAFKNLQTLECVDIDPRMLMGWDRLAESLRSLTLRKSGIEDLTEVFVDAVMEDQARRHGEAIKLKRRRMVHRNTDSRRPSWRGPAPPVAIREEPEIETASQGTESPTYPPLSGLKWAFLKHLCLADNSLTFFPANIIPHLLSVTYLDLSSNLLVSVPSGLNQMYNLVTLNLSDNMIESVLGIYTMLGQVLTLNLSRNRIDSLCGLERLVALERVDVRKNEVSDIGEVGRLATLPNLQGVWIEGNPFTETNPEYRIACFNQFLKEGKNVALDGLPPSFMERRSLITIATIPSGMKSPGLIPSPPVVAVGTPSPTTVTVAVDAKVAELGSPTMVSVQTPTRKKRPTRRLVDLDGGPETMESPSTPRRSHRRGHSDAMSPQRGNSPHPKTGEGIPIVIESPASPRKSSHGRGMTVHEGASSPPLLSPRIRSPTLNAVGSGFATVSGNGTTSKRRTKLSPAMFASTTEETPSLEAPKDAGGAPESPRLGGAGAFRAEIEALRASAPDNWLKVLSQKQFGSGQDGREGGSLRVGSPGTDAEAQEGRKRRHLRGVTEF
jgi:Leucine-rich repeat (LRR) protein